MHDWRWSLTKPYFKRIIEQKSKILDIGAGDLYLSSVMRDELNCDVAGVDIKDYRSNLVDFKLITNNKIPFSDNSFDYAIFNCVLHHIPKEKQESIIREAKRVAKNLIVFDDNPGFWRLIDALLNKQPIKTFGHRKVNDWVEFFNRLGIEVIFYKVKKPIYYPIRHCMFTTKL